MKVPVIKSKWIIVICIILWAIFLTSLALPNIVGSRPELLGWLTVEGSLASLSTIIAFVVVLFGLAGKDERDKALLARPANVLLNRALATLIILCLVLGTYCAVHSLSLGPDTSVRYAYNNTANGLGFAAIVLTFVLNAQQKNLFWYSKSRAMKLDERQLKERYEVLELSYKVGTVIVLGAAVWLSSAKASLPHIINDPATFNVTPGAMFWPFFNVAITLFALPLIVAAFKKK